VSRSALKLPTCRHAWNEPVMTSATIAPNASAEYRLIPCRSSSGSVRTSTTASSSTRPPSQQDIASTWIASAGIASPV
jgi:hypothetical protein